MELEQLTGCQRMRRVRGDHYGILRAALCQMVMKRLAVPRTEEAMGSIDCALRRGHDWIRQWTFGHRLPYGPDNVLSGMRQCLEQLDHLVNSHPCPV